MIAYLLSPAMDTDHQHRQHLKKKLKPWVRYKCVYLPMLHTLYCQMSGLTFPYSIINPPYQMWKIIPTLNKTVFSDVELTFKSWGCKHFFNIYSTSWHLPWILNTSTANTWRRNHKLQCFFTDVSTFDLCFPCWKSIIGNTCSRYHIW